MNDRTKTVGPVARKLESIHRRMGGVSEEEAMAALLAPESHKSESAAATVLTFTYVSAEPEARSGLAWTQTA